MDTSDDPTTIAFLGMAISGGAAAYSASQNKPGSPPVANPPAIQTTEVDQTLQDKSKKRKQKIMASVLTKDWDEPMLSQPGLLGVE